MYGKRGALSPLWGRKHSEETKALMRKNNVRTNFGKTMPEEVKKKISETLKGRLFSEAHRKKLSIAGKGRITSEETKKKQRAIHSNRPQEWNDKISKGKKGKPSSLKGTKNSLMCGKNNPAWKGGVTAKNHLIRTSFEYEEWRRTIFERDNYTCQVCSKRNGDKEVHHINRFVSFPLERFDLNNGITVCKGKCHYYLDNLSKETEQRTATLEIC